MADIAVVDDERNIRNTLKDILEDNGHTVHPFQDGEAFLGGLERRDFDVVLMDIRMPGKSGMEVLELLKAGTRTAEVVMISGHGTIDLAVEAVRAGAYDFLQKPLSLEKVEISVKHALDFKKQKDELTEWRESKGRKYQMVGQSVEMQNLKKEISKVAPTRSAGPAMACSNSSSERGKTVSIRCRSRSPKPG